MAKKPTDEELLARIGQEVTVALGNDDELSDQRREAMDRYWGLPYGNEIEGRSQVCTTDTQDVIEWIKPSLVRIFASTDQIVKFHPEEETDIPYAEQATAYVNFILTRDNNWFDIFTTWVTDALLQKLGIVKVWWDDSDPQDREEYHDLDEMEFDKLLADDEVEVLEHTEKESEPVMDHTGMLLELPQLTHDLAITRHEKKGRVKIENVPPDEFLIDRDAKSIADARFVCHRVRKTLTDMRELGYDVDPERLGNAAGDIAAFSAERSSRYEFDQSSPYGFDGTSEEALKEFWLYESYLRTDYDGDGIAEKRRVLSVGDQILENEPIDRFPFCSITPIKIPHRLFGMSVADQVGDIQLIKTTLMRNLLDSAYLQNSGRMMVVEGQVNLDDLVTSRPGGIVRTRAPGAVTPLPTPPLQPYVFDMLQYMDQIREERSGIARMSQGLDENALTSHTSATQVAQVMTAAAQRVELIARQFAETGVKDLMYAVYELVQKHQDKERVIQLRNKWLPVRPDMWKDKMDCVVAVGLGHGNRDQQLMHLSQLMQFASQAMSGGLSIVNEQNLYNLGAELIKNMGFKDVESFLTDPSKQQQQQGPGTQEQMAQQEMLLKQGELEVKIAETQIKQQKLQLEAAQSEQELQLKAAELKLEAEQHRPVAIGDT
jgi:hypothetical protein|tara:strand:+ start:83 stop:2059 length:1977 start_codon:yes stop_codon:yes gene_type:complete